MKAALERIATQGRNWAANAPLNLINAVVHPKAITDLAYGTHPRQRLDLYLNPRASSTVMYLHGGYWDSGDKRDYPFMADALLNMGFNAAIVNYRLAPPAVFPDFVTDAALAVRWLSENLERLTGRDAPLFVLGHSAGAHIMALLCASGDHMARVGATRGLIRAAVGMSGPYDFLDWIPTDERMKAAFGDSSRWAQTQPVLTADGLNPPVLLLHGERDDLCTPLHAPALRDAIVRCGGEAQFRWYPKLNHFNILGTFSRIGRWLEPRVVPDVKAFFEAHRSSTTKRDAVNGVTPEIAG
jgi:acetyl esterase/lipase